MARVEVALHAQARTATQAADEGAERGEVDANGARRTTQSPPSLHFPNRAWRTPNRCRGVSGTGARPRHQSGEVHRGLRTVSQGLIRRDSYPAERRNRWRRVYRLETTDSFACQRCSAVLETPA